MAINFPDSPANNDTFTSGGKTWLYNGTSWNLITLTQNVIPSNSVTSASIVDGTIVNADVNTSAAITYGKLSLSNSVVNSDISSSAAIALSKLATSTAGNIIVYNSSGVPTSVAETGDVVISDSGVTAISSGVIVDADIANTTITNSKLANASVTIGSTAIALGSSNTTIDGLTSITSANANVSTKLSVTSVSEPMLVSATAATGTVTINYLSNPSVFYTTNASANWTLNVRGNSTVTMNSSIAVGDVATVVFMAQQGATAYFANVVQVDGTTITPKWQGGTAPTGGNASSIDSYALSILKTAANTYTVLASQTKFA
jgi:hypothetical protein